MFGLVAFISAQWQPVVFWRIRFHQGLTRKMVPVVVFWNHLSMGLLNICRIFLLSSCFFETKLSDSWEDTLRALQQKKRENSCFWNNSLVFFLRLVPQTGSSGNQRLEIFLWGVWKQIMLLCEKNECCQSNKRTQQRLLARISRSSWISSSRNCEHNLAKMSKMFYLL